MTRCVRLFARSGMGRWQWCWGDASRVFAGCWLCPCGVFDAGYSEEHTGYWLKRELATLKWFSMFGELYEDEDPEVPGANADFIRSVAMYRLLCILMMDDSPEKVANMRCYIAWLNNALDLLRRGGWIRLSRITRDFTIGGIYASGYAPNAFHVASILVYLLYDTPFAVADDKRDNLKQALLTSRIMANTYDISMAVNGRFPRNTAVATKLLPAYMYVALSYSPVDAELSGAFMQLWKPDSQLLIKDMFERVSVRLMYLHTPGAMQMMADFAEAGYAPAAPPSGHWTSALWRVVHSSAWGLDGEYEGVEQVRVGLRIVGEE